MKTFFICLLSVLFAFSTMPALYANAPATQYYLVGHGRDDHGHNHHRGHHNGHHHGHHNGHGHHGDHGDHHGHR